jgi:hypothetical protein
MRLNIRGSLAAAALGLALVSPAAAQTKPSIAVMPTGYFTATSESADNVTQGLSSQFEGQGYRVMGTDQAQSAFQTLGLNRSQHYADRVALKFGRQMGSDLVAYPRLLAVGVPISGETVKTTELLQPAAVVHLRVLNVHTGQAIYFRQIAHEFNTDAPTMVSSFQLPSPVATASANEVTQMYFQRVAGSRQEYRGTR